MLRPNKSKIVSIQYVSIQCQTEQFLFYACIQQRIEQVYKQYKALKIKYEQILGKLQFANYKNKYLEDSLFDTMYTFNSKIMEENNQNIEDIKMMNSRIERELAELQCMEKTDRDMVVKREVLSAHRSDNSRQKEQQISFCCRNDEIIQQKSRQQHSQTKVRSNKLNINHNIIQISLNNNQRLSRNTQQSQNQFLRQHMSNIQIFYHQDNINRRSPQASSAQYSNQNSTSYRNTSKQLHKQVSGRPLHQKISNPRMQNGLNGIYQKEEIIKSHQHKDKKKMGYMNGNKAEKTNKSNNGKQNQNNFQRLFKLQAQWKLKDFMNKFNNRETSMMSSYKDSCLLYQYDDKSDNSIDNEDQSKEIIRYKDSHVKINKSMR